jgi:3-oxo-5-alpha-steroid 4-dehydrogenase 3
MYVQHDSLKRLAEIRRGSLKNKERVGQPTGGWFDYVSSPHFFGELLVYTGLCILQEFSNACMNLVLMFCVINQTLVALETHAWYVRTFKDYPKGRKAIIPFLL